MRQGEAFSPVAGPEVLGGGRYQIVRRLGEGGMGVVYEAYDRDRRHLVALKTLRAFDADALYRFKQEFRTVADVHHTNLVRLCELIATEDGEVFFTMELVHGVNFTRYVQRSPPSTSVPPASTVVIVEPAVRERDTVRPGSPARAEKRHAPTLTSPDVDRLRAALCQLAKGVHAIHAQEQPRPPAALRLGRRDPRRPVHGPPEPRSEQAADRGRDLAPTRRFP